MIQSIAALLKQVPFFQDLSEDTLEELTQIGSIQYWDAAKVVFGEADPPDRMYLILAGSVEIRKAVAPGKTILLKTLGAGDFFGEMALIDRSPRAASAVAETHCSLLPISRSEFLGLVKNNPAFGVSLLKTLADRLRFMTSHLRSA